MGCLLKKLSTFDDVTKCLGIPVSRYFCGTVLCRCSHRKTLATAALIARLVRRVTAVDWRCSVTPQETLRLVWNASSRDTSTLFSFATSPDLDHHPDRCHVAVRLVSSGEWRLFDDRGRRFLARGAIQVPQAGPLRVRSLIRHTCRWPSDCLPVATAYLDYCYTYRQVIRDIKRI